MKKIFAFGSYFNDFRNSLNEANDMNLIDISAELEREFGAYGSEERKKSLDQAWEEYNAQILLDARKSVHLTQQELARRTGTTKGYISRVERGLIVPTVATLYKLIGAMGLKIEIVPR